MTWDWFSLILWSAVNESEWRVSVLCEWINEWVSNEWVSELIIQWKSLVSESTNILFFFKRIFSPSKALRLVLSDSEIWRSRSVGGEAKRTRLWTSISSSSIFSESVMNLIKRLEWSTLIITQPCRKGSTSKVAVHSFFNTKMLLSLNF